MALIILLLLIPFSFSSSWQKNHLISGCSIFNSAGIELKKFPGFTCVFFPNGYIASVQDNSIQYLSPESKVVWELKGYFHHQLNLNQDGTKLLALSIEEAEFNKEKVKVDRPVIIDLTGKIIAAVSMKKFIQRPHLRFADFKVNHHFGLQKEISHLNSFYEIPRADKSKPAQYILNGLHDGIFILSEDLQRVITTFTLSEAKGHNVHDVQILDSGKLLAFINFSSRSDAKLESSEIMEFDYLKKEVVFRYPYEPDPFFFSPVAGSVQKLSEGMYLFTTVNSGSFIYSLADKKVIRSYFETHMVGGALVPVQQVKSQDLSSFLGHWK